MILKRKDALNGPANMHKSRKIPITDLNEHLTCVLCSGYFIDATTIIECLHSFCRSCIVKYLEKHKYCPICDVQVHKTKPLLNIRADQTLQDIVYKLVPRLFHNEMLRRRDFYSMHTEAKSSVGPEQRGEAVLPYVLTPEETMCLSLEYHNNNNNNNGDNITATETEAISQGRRYLRCPAAVSVGHLQKLLRSKYGLTEDYQVEVLHNLDILDSDLTLMDLAYIYLWRRKGPLHLTYRIYEFVPTKKSKLMDVTDNLTIRTELGRSEQLPPPSTLPTENNLVPIATTITTTTTTTSTTDSRKEKAAAQEIKKPETTNKKEDNNKNWKEVQLQISENGIMSVMGIGIGATAEVEVALDKKKEGSKNVDAEKSKNAIVTTSSSTTTATTSTTVSSTTTTKTKNEEKKQVIVSTTASTTRTQSSNSSSSGTVDSNSGTTGNIKKNTPKEDKAPKNEDKLSKRDYKIGKHKLESSVATTVTTSTPVTASSSLSSSVADSKNHDAKIPKFTPSQPPVTTSSVPTTSAAVPSVTTAPTILNSEAPSSNNNNNSIKNSIHNLSRNHPLKIHSSSNKISSPNPHLQPVSAAPSVVFSKPQAPPVNNRTSLHQQQQQQLLLPRPGTPIAVPQTTANKYKQLLPPPPPSAVTIKNGAYNPVLNVPKVGGGSGANKKTPVYKTLRDPPKSWNPQLPPPSPRQQQQQQEASTSNGPVVGEKKFFKMRNNLPRYLGNPASGVKPLYAHSDGGGAGSKQSVDSPKKNDRIENNIEIKKHSIVTIDPKTLKPVSEKAPESSSLTTETTTPPQEMRINQSTVPIFNRSQKMQTSPKSPKVNSSTVSSAFLHDLQKSPTSLKKDKLNLNFTPSNPFVPNLTSPTLNPNQFVYPGFPGYDPRLLNAYHNLGFLYGPSRLSPYSTSSPGPSATAPQMPQSLMSTLNLELNKNAARKNYNMKAPGTRKPDSPKEGAQSKSLQSAVEKLTVEAKNKAQNFNVDKLVATKDAAASKQNEEPKKITSVEKDSKEIAAKVVTPPVTDVKQPKNNNVETAKNAEEQKGV